jgi:Short C-terminal domain
VTDPPAPPEDAPAAAAPDPVPPAPATPPGKLSRRRSIGIWSLVVLASVIGLITILTVWVNRQLLDNGQFRKASSRLVQDPTIRASLSVYLVNQLYNNVDVSGQLEKQLPNTIKPLAGPVAAGLRQPAVEAVDFLLSQPRVQQTFVNATGIAHQKLVNVLENKSGYGIDTGNGVVTVNLSELVKELGTDLGLPAAALARIPPGTGVITVMKSDQLHAAQQGVQLIRVLSVWLVILVLVLYGIAIYLAHGHRRSTLRNIGWALVLVGLIVLVVHRATGNYAVNALVQPENRPAAHRIWLIESSILGDTGKAVVFYGLVIVLAAILAGPHAFAIRFRRWMAPTLAARPGMSWGILAGAYLLLVLWGPTHALQTVWGVLLLGALVAAGFYALRRQTLAENPEAADHHGEGMASVRALGARAASHRPQHHSGGTTPADQIAHLNDLHKSGALTDEEFAQAKQLALKA